MQSQYLFHEAIQNTESPLKKVGLMGTWQDISSIIDTLRERMVKPDEEFTEDDVRNLGKAAKFKSGLFKKAGMM